MIPLPNRRRVYRDETQAESSDHFANGSCRSHFDLQNQFDLLDTAHLYVPELVLMRGNRPLTYFDINLGQH